MLRSAGRWIARAVIGVFVLALLGGVAMAQKYERRDVTIPSQGLNMAAWYYVPDMKAGEKRPVVVMAHGFSAVKEMYLDNFASKFAKAGFAVVVFDYRYFGGSQGEPRGQILWPEQLVDYRNAISWATLQKEVDAERIGVWGTSYSGGHVMVLGAYDRRIKAVVAQVPVTDIWDTYLSKMPPEQLKGMFKWAADARTERLRSGKIATIPVAAPVDQPSWWPLQEWYDAFMDLSKNAPAWRNEIVVESVVETGSLYAPTAAIDRISPTPFLMVIASDDIITPTAAEKEAFSRAKEPKKLVEVQGRHFEAYHGPKHDQFALPAVEWFKQWLMK